MTDLSIVGDIWRDVSSTSTLLTFKDIYKASFTGSAIAIACSTSTTLPGVSDACLNAEYPTFFQPNDTFYAQQWHLNNLHQVWVDSGGDTHATLPQVDMDLELAWDIFQGTGNLPVYVIDTGIDWDHSDLELNRPGFSGELVT